MKAPIQALEDAVLAAGGQRALAEKINQALGENIKTPQKQGHVWAWLNREGAKVPAEFCTAIQKISKGAAFNYELRPDVFAAPKKRSTN